MLMMDFFAGDPDVVVAHFDHGMRPSSKDDAAFVEKMAKKYGFPFILGKSRLGENASEAQARDMRYRFLESVADSVDGVIYTAHHANDVAESVAINLIRGTGWRGLAPFSRENVYRPFIYEYHNPMSKYDIYRFAAEREIVFRQDPTNNEPKYLRNRIREKVYDELYAPELGGILDLYMFQRYLRQEIDLTVAMLLPEDGRFQRSWFKKLDDGVALEILRGGLLRAGISATRPQILDFLHAIRTYAPGKSFNLPLGHLVVLHKTYFVL